MNAVVMQLILIALPIVLTPLVGLVVMWVQQFIAHLPANQRTFLATIANDVVLAVEQAEKNSGMSGVDKKALAMKLIMAELDHWGVKIPPEIISTLIESAVPITDIVKKSSEVPVRALSTEPLGPAMKETV